jgi:uncharacterized protein (DUF983 family)
MKPKALIDDLRDILRTRCPRCRRVSMFQHPALHLGGMLKMHRRCPVCGQDFMPEPGFYFGAMYFSYAINVALMVVSGVTFYLLFRPESVLLILGSVLMPPMLLAPWNFRISRALMLYLLGGVKRDNAVEAN